MEKQSAFWQERNCIDANLTQKKTRSLRAVSRPQKLAKGRMERGSFNFRCLPGKEKKLPFIVPTPATLGHNIRLAFARCADDRRQRDTLGGESARGGCGRGRGQRRKHATALG
jgi:hypothetical protein